MDPVRGSAVDGALLLESVVAEPARDNALLTLLTWMAVLALAPLVLAIAGAVLGWCRAHSRVQRPIAGAGRPRRLARWDEFLAATGSRDRAGQTAGGGDTPWPR
jgi:hypothetical protein